MSSPSPSEPPPLDFKVWNAYPGPFFTNQEQLYRNAALYGQSCYIVSDIRIVQKGEVGMRLLDSWKYSFGKN